MNVEEPMDSTCDPADSVNILTEVTILFFFFKVAFSLIGLIDLFF